MKVVSRQLAVPAAIGFLVMGTGLASCMASANPDQLKARSAFDLNCPQNPIQTTPIDERTMGVTGCGQRAVYVESCDGDKASLATKCTWVLNFDSTPKNKD